MQQKTLCVYERLCLCIYPCVHSRLGLCVLVSVCLCVWSLKYNCFAVTSLTVRLVLRPSVFQWDAANYRYFKYNFKYK